MKIRRLQIENLRIINKLVMEPCEGLNFVCGPNGAGKTSILEAIYLLGQGKSFRHSEAGPFIRNGKDSCLVVADLEDGRGVASRLGIQRGKKEFLARHGGKDIKRRSELLRLLPVQIVTPQSHELLERGPELRRRYLDYGLFHVEQSYHQILMSYQRAIKQRNAALRAGNARLASSFNEQLSMLAEKIAASRYAMLQAVEGYLQSFLRDMSFSEKVSLQMYTGWKAECSLTEVLRDHLDRELAQGYTSAGPHRAELKILVAGGRAEKHLSRGQQKVLVYGLVFALSRMMVEKLGEAPVLLIDDLGAELDERNRAALIDYLENTCEQAFISSVNIPGSLVPVDSQVFHVEHGALRTT